MTLQDRGELSIDSTSQVLKDSSVTGRADGCKTRSGWFIFQLVGSSVRLFMYGNQTRELAFPLPRPE